MPVQDTFVQIPKVYTAFVLESPPGGPYTQIVRLSQGRHAEPEGNREAVRR